MLGAILVHDRDVAIEQRGKLLRCLRAAHVGGHHAKLLGVEAHGLVVVHEDGHRGHVVHRLVEEALDSVLVQVDRDNVVSTGGGEQVGDELRRDRLARSGLAILAGVAVMRDDGAHAVGARALGGVDHDEQLHQVVVDVEAIGARAHGLHDEHVRTAHAFEIARVDFAVRELLKLHITQGNAQFVSDFVRQPRVGRSRKYSDSLHLLEFHAALLLVPVDSSSSCPEGKTRTVHCIQAPRRCARSSRYLRRGARNPVDAQRGRANRKQRARRGDSKAEHAHRRGQAGFKPYSRAHQCPLFNVFRPCWRTSTLPPPPHTKTETAALIDFPIPHCGLDRLNQKRRRALARSRVVVIDEPLVFEVALRERNMRIQ